MEKLTFKRLSLEAILPAFSKQWCHSMQPLRTADASTFEGVRFVLTDMDETLTYKGRLAAATYLALERLQGAGVKVIPVTAAPAGWCDQMARFWPVDGVIGENGGLFFRRADSGHGVQRHFWHADLDLKVTEKQLRHIAEKLQASIPALRLADDQPFRMTSIAFARPEERDAQTALLHALRTEGADSTINNLWVLGWLGGYDKLSMTRRILLNQYGLDIDTHADAVLYVGDSTNDAPMFSFFHHTVGVSTVADDLDQIPVAPRWITSGPGGAGFVEAADAILATRGAT